MQRSAICTKNTQRTRGAPDPVRTYRWHAQQSYALAAILILLLLFFQSIGVARAAVDCRFFSTKTPSLEETALTNSEALLWEINSPLTAKTSYLLGTIHSSHNGIDVLPRKVLHALSHADTFIMEMLLSPEVMEELLAMSYYPAGRKTLSAQLDPALYQRVETILTGHQIPPQMIVRMRPWAAFLAMNYNRKPSLPLDFILLGIAAEKNLIQLGLENAKEALQSMTNLSQDEQILLLTDSVCNYALIQENIGTIEKLYVKQDLRGIIREAASVQTDEEPLYERLLYQLIEKRNHHFVRRLVEPLSDGGAFIAVGAMHLPGETGIVNLLKQRGYRLTPIRY